MAQTTIKAYQLLFSRVESAAFARIPKTVVKQSGYQLAFYSQAIAGEAEAIKKRVQCFQPKDDEITRSQFFQLESGRVVLAFSQRITPDEIINDPNRRSGVFIAHCLIFEATDFYNRLRNNPFPVFDTFGFADQAQNLIEIAQDADNQERITIPVDVAREVDTEQLKRFTDRWDKQELQNFIALTERDMGSQTLSLIGDSTSIEDTLYLAFQLAEPRNRLHMSFDTAVDNCQPAAGTYWAVGAAMRISNAQFVQIDLSRPKITLVGEQDSKKGTVYGNWLKDSLANGALADTLRKAPILAEIAAAFEAGQGIPESVERNVAYEFIVVNRDLILDRFKVALATRLSKDVAESLTEYAVEAFTNQQPLFSEAEVINAASQGQFPEPQPLAAHVYSWLVSSKYDRISKEVDSLLKLAEEANNPCLLLLAILGAPSSIVQRLTRVIRKNDNSAEHDVMNDLVKTAQFPSVLQDLAGFEWTVPARFVTPKTAPMVEQYYAQNPPQDEGQFVDLLNALIKADARLQAFIPHLNSLKKNSLTRIAKAASEHNDNAKSPFTKALDSLLNNNPK